MDRLIYSRHDRRDKHILEQQATTSHNLANSTTTGFSARQIDQFRAVAGGRARSLPTRAFRGRFHHGSDFRGRGRSSTPGRELGCGRAGRRLDCGARPADGTRPTPAKGS